MKYFVENDGLDKKWTESYFNGNWRKCIRFPKEDNSIFHPYNMLPNGEIDENL